MRRKRPLWRIYLSFFWAAMVAFAATAWFAARSLQHFYQEQVAGDLKVRAEIIAKGLLDSHLETAPDALDRYCKELGALTATRITVVLPDGRVIADAEKDPAGMENHAGRPEVAAAMAGDTGCVTRYSDTLGRTLMYLAIPVIREGRVTAVVRTSLPLTVLDQALATLFRHIALGGTIVVALFGLVAIYLSQRISRPLEAMRQVAERLAAGELSARVPAPADDEAGALAVSLNKMAVQLSERLQTIIEQRNEQETVFASMVEGVLAVDDEGRILYLNPAASRLLMLDPIKAMGKSVLECVRNPYLQRFISSTLASETVMEGEIVLRGEEERFLQLHGTTLKAGGAAAGALVVLNDVTGLKRLETVRRDFVANVSHELKTPITAIKGCVETLAEGGLGVSVEAGRFLAMMARQVGRLEAIVEDLLSLSRIEFGAERGWVRLTPGSVTEVLRRAVQTFTKPAHEKAITLALECPEETLMAPIDAALLEQAVGNLIDNAIKYSGPGTTVKLSVAARENEVEIRVIDQGPGIEKQHLSRVFERFYRVDKVRSRTLGGTGLGLAIVRHVARAHNGTAGVESTPGQGSSFFIRFPRVWVLSPNS